MKFTKTITKETKDKKYTNDVETKTFSTEYKKEKHTIKKPFCIVEVIGKTVIINEKGAYSTRNLDHMHTDIQEFIQLPEKRAPKRKPQPKKTKGGQR